MSFAGMRLFQIAGPIALILTLGACQEKAEDVAAVPEPVVQVTTVQPVSLARVTTYTGVVRPRVEVQQAFRVAGKIVERRVDVGDRVRAGDILARLETTDLMLTVDRADASVEAATTNRARALAERRRTQTLLDKGHATPADLEGQDLAVAEAESRLKNAEKERELARNQLSYADLKASEDGVVSAVAAEAGQVVAAGTPIATVARLSEREVAVAIPESKLPDLEGSTAVVTLWAGDQSFMAKLREVAPEADPATRTYAARFALVEGEAAVQFGMTATVTLTKGDPTPVIRLPSTAIMDEGKGPVVFTVAKDTRKLTKVPVSVGRYEANDVVLTAGLEAGTQVVTMGPTRLKDGAVVRPALIN
jgi:RND family efflux transporter MFP subunit